MSEKQYTLILDLYHEYYEAFLTLGPEIQRLFYARLYGG